MGGLPVRGDLLAYWEPVGPVSEADRRQWIRNAERIATGLMELAHLPAFVDPRSYRVGFFCDGNTELARSYVEAINAERIEARQVSPPLPGSTSGDGKESLARRAAKLVTRLQDDELPADEVVLPCRPDAEDEEIVHAVLATMKASHALEFEVVLDDEQALGVLSGTK
jgi:hypothetical protein